MTCVNCTAAVLEERGILRRAQPTAWRNCLDFLRGSGPKRRGCFTHDVDGAEAAGSCGEHPAAEDLLPRLDAVRRARRALWPDALHMRTSRRRLDWEGERGLLVKCWAGCTL